MFINILQPCNVRSGGLVLGIAFTLTSLFPLATFSRDSIEKSIVTAKESDHALVDLHANGPLGEAAGSAITLSHHERDGEYDNQVPGNPPGRSATGNPAFIGGVANPVHG